MQGYATRSLNNFHERPTIWTGITHNPQATEALASKEGLEDSDVINDGLDAGLTPQAERSQQGTTQHCKTVSTTTSQPPTNTAAAAARQRYANMMAKMRFYASILSEDAAACAKWEQVMNDHFGAVQVEVANRGKRPRIPSNGERRKRQNGRANGTNRGAAQFLPKFDASNVHIESAEARMPGRKRKSDNPEEKTTEIDKRSKH